MEAALRLYNVPPDRMPGSPGSGQLMAAGDAR